MIRFTTLTLILALTACETPGDTAPNRETDDEPPSPVPVVVDEDSGATIDGSWTMLADPTVPIVLDAFCCDDGLAVCRTATEVIVYEAGYKVSCERGEPRALVRWVGDLG